MKKLSLFLLCLLICLFNNIKEVKASEYYAKSYIVMEKESKEILEGKDYYNTQSVASISKLMTFYVAYKYMDLDMIVTVGEEINTIIGSAVYLEENEQITLYELLVALLLRSANDAAVVIAKYVVTSIEKFVNLMNEEAKELGMDNTLFSNPHGLDEFDEGNISCAFDMALLLCELLDNKTFLSIEKINKYNSYNHGIWFNKNKLMKQYKYTTSCKTGFTRKAKRTLVSSAKKNNKELVICTLNCSNDFAYHKYLYDSYFC
jgi:D-alanyl-D-alanine carboxypeptidase